MHANVASRAPAVAAARADRPQRGRTPLGTGVVGEDVIDLVPPPPRAQPSHIGALAVAILELDLGLVVGLDLLFVRVVLGETEVNERAVPCVAECHMQSQGSWE